MSAQVRIFARAETPLKTPPKKMKTKNTHTDVLIMCDEGPAATIGLIMALFSYALLCATQLPPLDAHPDYYVRRAGNVSVRGRMHWVPLSWSKTSKAAWGEGRRTLIPREEAT